MKIRNIIFDLGGVIIGIDYSKTAQAFKRLGAQNFDEVYSQSKQNGLFDSYDVGEISSFQFRTKVKEVLGLPHITDAQFDTAWNAMLLDFPPKVFEFLSELKKQYKIFLFSNTNEIHLSEVYNICFESTGRRNFDGIFDKEYYSHTFGHRKPNPASFKKLLAENGLQAEETLFVDDSLQHIRGAQSVGIQTIHIANGLSIFNVPALIIQLEKKEADSEDQNPHQYVSTLMRFN